MANLKTIVSFCNMKSWLINSKIYFFHQGFAFSSWGIFLMLLITKGNRQNNGSWRYLCPNSQNLWIYKLHGKGELRMQIKLQLLISWPSDRERILDYPDWPNTITRFLKSGTGNWKRESEMVVWENLSLIEEWGHEPRKTSSL